MQMKAIIFTVALTIASTSATAACSTTTINTVMASAIPSGSSVLNVSGLLGCAPDQTPTPNSTSSTLTWSVISSTKQQIVVNFAGAGSVSARYQEIPLSAGVNGGNSNSSTQEAVAVAAIIALGAFKGGQMSIGSPAASGCTPATINPGAVSRIRPHSTIETAIAMLGCSPTEVFFAEKIGVTKYKFLVPMLDVELDVFSDSLGVSFAIYIDRTNPIERHYNGALRIEPPLTPNWMPSAGVVPNL